MPRPFAPSPAPGPTAWHANVVGAISAVARFTPGGTVEEAGGVTIARSGVALPAFNCVFVLDPPSSLEGLEARIERAFGDGRLPWSVMTTNETAPRLEPIARAFGLDREAVLPGMVWEPLGETPRPPAVALEIRPITDPRSAQEFVRTMMVGFEGSPELLLPWAGGIAARGRFPPGVHCYLGYVAGRPVASALRFTTPGVAGIYGVATLPEFRRRGFGEALTRRAALDGREEGCRQSYLQSSEMGRSVYERIGYRAVEEYREWAHGSARRA